jgi:hypothetical protein
VTKWLKTVPQISSDSVDGRLQCTFCWQGALTPKVSNHSAKDCPLLKKFNAKRTTKDLQLITIGQHSINAHALKEPVSTKELVDQFEQLKTEMTTLLAQLDRRLKVVECGLKRKAEDPAAPVDPHPPKRKKKGPVKDATGTPPKTGKKSGKKCRMVKEASPA